MALDNGGAERLYRHVGSQLSVLFYEPFRLVLLPGCTICESWVIVMKS
jgi:hypothetical protein